MAKRRKLTPEDWTPFAMAVLTGDHSILDRPDEQDAPRERRRPENDLLRRLMAIEERLAAHALFFPGDYANSYGIGDGSLTVAQQLQDLRNRIHAERLRLGR